MEFETFALERQQSIWENKVDYNLSESGVHPGSLNSLFDKKFVDEINNTEPVSYTHLTLPTISSV